MSKSNLLTQNSKMRKASILTWNWTLPAYKSRTGLATCPMAGECARGCYAQQGAYTWRNVYTKHENNLALTQNAAEFTAAMTDELERVRKSGERRGKQVAVRIHDSGDFYSLSYLNSWLGLVAAFPTIQFYAYTKMVPLFRRPEVSKFLESLPNLTIIFSEGGRADHLIDTRRDRHSRVFSSREELQAAGYVDASTDDTVAWRSTNHRIGLVYHGAKSRAWTTGDTADTTEKVA